LRLASWWYIGQIALGSVLAGPLEPAPLLAEPLLAAPLVDPAAVLLAAADSAALDCPPVCDVLGELGSLDGVLVPLVQPAINDRQLAVTARANPRMEFCSAAVM
jgi:hypothetical protein